MQLRDDQIAAARWLASRTEAFVPAPIGWGKTVVALTAFEDIRARYGPWRALVVSTLNIVNRTWPAEIRGWAHLSHLSYASAAGRNKKSVLARPDVLGVNFENLEWFYDLVDSDPTLLPEVLFIDESHHMKSFHAARVKRHVGWTKKKEGQRQRQPGYAHRFKRRFALSGTPTTEGYADLYTQECSISLRRRLGVNITMFRRLMCQEEWVGERLRFTVDRIGEERIEQALAPITYQASMNRYLPTDPPVFSTRWVPWSPAAREEYDKLDADFELDLREKLQTAKPEEDLSGVSREELAVRGLAAAVAPNEGVLYGKLRQARSGFVYDIDSRARLLSDSDALIHALASLRAEVDAPLLVFTQYKAEDDMIRERFPGVQIGLPKSLDMWDAKRVPMMVLHPESAGEGLNLQFGTHVCIYYNMPWSYGLWKQSWGRLDRGRQTRQVSVIRLARPDCIDGYVWDKVVSKGAKADKFLGGVTGSV
jgi:hypothetical protein